MLRDEIPTYEETQQKINQYLNVDEDEKGKGKSKKEKKNPKKNKKFGKIKKNKS